MTETAMVRVRVTVTATWDTVTLDAQPSTSVTMLKQRALAETLRDATNPSAYLVKFRGATVTDEARTVSDLSIPNDGTLIVLPARRHPVR